MGEQMTFTLDVVAACGPYYSFRPAYYYLPMERERTCVNDYLRQGCERVPEGAERPK